MSPDFCIEPLARSLTADLQAKIDAKTKPHGALGQLEALALQIGLLQNSVCPQLRQPAILVFAADHGIAQSGVSAYPAAVTAQMVLNFANGGAAINVFARQHGIELTIVDAGVDADLSPVAGVVDAKIARGTANFLHEPAMSDEQCSLALQRGRQLAHEAVDAGCNVLGFGEMGIGNTSSAAALMSVLCSLPVAECVGRGTGLDESGVLRKQHVIQQALELHRLDAAQPLRALACVGGFEIAMMCGAMLGAAERGALLLIDGFIASAAFLVACRLHATVGDYAVFCHCSDEAGHARLLAQLHAKPLLNLNMRLGEGSGCALAYPIVQAAVAFLNEMASFESASVSRSL